MSQIGRYGKLAVWIGGILALLHFGLLDGILRSAGQGGLLRSLSPLANLWWVPLAAGVLAVLADRRGSVEALVGGTQAGIAGSAPNRHEIIAPTNWRHQNQLVLQRSLGLSLLVATAVGAATTILLKETTAVFTGYDTALGFLVLVAAAGTSLLVVSSRSTRHIRDDHTHRVSVRLPDLFSVHSFHVHLRQQAEDLGFAVRNEASPERSGVPTGYDDSIFLSKGGFTTRKRPVPASASLIDDGLVSELLSLASLGAFAVVLGVLLYFSPGSLVVEGIALTLPLVVVCLGVGVTILLKDYLDRTNHWAELYCVMEGTIYNPETRLYDDSVDVALEHATPQVADSETSCEMIVTVGAGCSPSFDEHQLEDDFATFVDSIEDLAAANQYRIVNNNPVAKTPADD